LVVAGRQQLPHIWWKVRRSAFDLVISQVVLDEVRTGDPDAAHMAVAAYHGVDFLMTWNVTHIANATLRRRVEDVCREQGYGAPILCTPDELMEDADE
jgi:hypothetical protein